ncbi:hypothetical protein SARC_00732 [Sphaeroforma arctica JP610]|uniref:CHK kinase-like domain-containing protein n=1 Tax=Sphaeroforma arctica JP610 TaxID=667725 RepID=A0A0L0GE49_9EUKA|nr:hypothetical protein SARC_00732 [Sphaeroforma arctica JP610]KNC87151.1 hypothetical protein SARC_00732 [Sphaeroforma arctica JP610]|eukprot:XP_014161053.1 hypothetical protein SARC_00732 [Sphaeroforma arctica JP610]
MDVITEEWLRNVVDDKDLVSLDSVTDMSQDSGRMGDMIKVVSTHSGDIVRHRIVKTLIGDQKLQMALQYGLSREAHVFNTFGAELFESGLIPRIYYATTNDITGSKTVMMEDLSKGHVVASVFFSKNSPHMKNADPKDEVNYKLSGKAVAELTFRTLARLHALHWNDTSLLTHSWLRNVDVLTANSGTDATTQWTTLADSLRSSWSKGQIREDITWDTHLLQCMDASIGKLSWESLHEENQSIPYTLCHGDFHAGNVLVDQANETVKFVDFEVSMVNIGPRELGQFTISNISTAERRQWEKTLVLTYHKELSKCLGDKCQISEEDCWLQYTQGCSRWVFFLALFVGTWQADAVTCQYFHDQIADFLHDHVSDPKDMVQPLL